MISERSRVNLAGFLRGRRGGRWKLFTHTILATLAGLALVAISPAALRFYSTVHGYNWLLLSNIGQTYGAVSALLVVLGLSGVVVTVFLQIREARHGRMQAARARQHDLVRMAMEDPVYMQVWGLGADQSFDERRQTMYINLSIQYWLMLWEFGDISEDELRVAMAADMFASNAGRRDWERHGNLRMKVANSRQQRQFFQILNDEYEKTVRKHPHGSVFRNSIALDPGPQESSPISTGIMMLASALAGAAIYRAARRFAYRLGNHRRS